ncbi:MAG: hypothetical protein J6K00_04080 [Oscillospiraceae bacterium]|nr:hypothetical protein [Oscillospiraceae bacterium]
MACDYVTEKWGNYYCVLKDSDESKISYAHYSDYCCRGNKQSCPIYAYWKKNK